MRRIFRWGVAIAALFIGAQMIGQGAAQAEEQACRVIRFVSWPMIIEPHGRIAVPIEIDGQTENMLIDTGAYYSILSRETVARLHLKPSPLANMGITMFGGQQSNLYVTPHIMMIGKIPFKDRSMYLLEGTFSDFDGLLGGDILQVFDLDFDFAAGKFSLYSQEHCPGKVVYWTKTPFAAIDFKLEGNHIVFTANIDGHDVKTILDTGAATSVMSLETASDILHMDEDTVKAKRGIGRANTLFKSFSFQGIQVNDPDIRLFSDEESKIMDQTSSAPRLIIGMGVLRQLHVYIAYKERKLYVTPAVP